MDFLYHHHHHHYHPYKVQHFVHMVNNNGAFVEYGIQVDDFFFFFFVVSVGKNFGSNVLGDEDCFGKDCMVD